MSGIAELGGGLLTDFGVEVDHDDLGSGGQEAFGGGAAEAGGSTGDECDGVREIHECPLHR